MKSNSDSGRLSNSPGVNSNDPLCVICTFSPSLLFSSASRLRMLPGW